MASVSREPKTKRIRLSISENDVNKIWGKDVSLTLVQHWIELGRYHEKRQLEINARDEIHNENIDKLKQEIQELKSSIAKLTELMLHSSKLLNLSSTFSHYELEVLKAHKRVGKENETQANQILLAEIKEENFERFIAEKFPGKKANRFVSTTTKREQ